MGGLVVGIGVFLLITSPLYLMGAYRLDSGNANIVSLITSFILFIAVELYAYKTKRMKKYTAVYQ
ncbi:hypothetical protein UA3_01379 [Enterococcus faecium EnGen0263]|nr:hypothetical protein UA3_01379 [Enterococcus faecium EnGen0263]